MGQCDQAVDELAHLRLEITLIKALGQCKGDKKHQGKINNRNRIVFITMVQRPMLTERIEYIVLDLPS